ncbi:glycosyltransferase [Cereibacter sphaeroides]|nr:glycosyltransferase [Cereibacter sphaeroides]
MKLSLVVCAYDMARELPRTIQTLSRAYQRGIDGLDYEIVVLDNGSPEPVDEAALRAITGNLRVVRIDDADPSPVRALNAVVRETSGDLIGLLIDGARMASPGLLRNALQAHRCDADKIIGTLAFHLGPDVQMRSVPAGYDQATEDSLLASTPWREDGYRLFDISVLAGSSAQGWFGTIAESNAVFLGRTLWSRLGGLEERFQSPGGGKANLDFWRRAVAASDFMPWILLGEGTFHQVHGGAATNGTDEARRLMSEEYRQILAGQKSRLPYQPQFMGTLSQKLATKFGAEPCDVPGRQAISSGLRPFKSDIPPNLLTQIQKGTSRTRYKKRRLAKNPFDLALYLRLLQTLTPKTIVEIGTSKGGSALWMRDQCKMLGLDCQIITIDITPPPPIKNIHVLAGDATRPAETFPHDLLATAPHPWLVIEDSAHTYDATRAVLSYFDPLLRAGDYMVVEDGIVADLPDTKYRRYEDGPNRAVRDFLVAHPHRYRIDESLCDFYGHNVTYCPNGWLIRTGKD